MYNQFVPQLSQSLGALSKILAKAEAHCEAKNITPERILNAGLSPDAFDFKKQVQTVTDFAFRGPSRLLGEEPESNPDTETSFAELIARVDRAKAYLDGYKEDAFENSATIEVPMKTPMGEIVLTGHQYLYSYTYPNFYFHLTTAYQILRHNGVEIGKMDYLGLA